MTKRLLVLAGLLLCCTGCLPERSTLPPGGKGMIMRTGFAGHVCANAADENAASTAAVSMSVLVCMPVAMFVRHVLSFAKLRESRSASARSSAHSRSGPLQQRSERVEARTGLNAPVARGARAKAHSTPRTQCYKIRISDIAADATLRLSLLFSVRSSKSPPGLSRA